MVLQETSVVSVLGLCPDDAQILPGGESQKAGGHAHVALPLLQSCWKSSAYASEIGIKGREVQTGTSKKAPATYFSPA